MAEQISYLIIGNGIAGVTAAEVLRAEDSKASIGVIADDPFPVYYRPALKDYLAGRVREDKLWARPTSFYQDQNIFFLSDRVTSIQANQHFVQLQSGKRAPYGKVLLATGASPARLACPGVNLRGVWTLRTVSDYQAVLERLNSVKRVVVVGSGTLALECAETLRHRGFQISHLIRRNRLWSEVLDATASDLVLQQERRAGVDLRLEEEIAEITGSQGEVTGVITSKGQRIACEMVLIAIGIEPNLDLIRSSGIPCRRGVPVDPGMRTGAPDVYAAGDLLETTDPVTGRTRVLGQWYPAIQQARAAAYSMLDLLESEQAANSGTFLQHNFYNATFLYGLDFASVGLANIGTGNGYQEIVAAPQPRTYRKVLLKDGIPVGVLALGDRRQVLAFKRAIDHRVSLLPVVGRLFEPDFNLKMWLDEQGVPPALLGVYRSREGTTVQRAVSRSVQKTQRMEKVVPQTNKPVEGKERMAKPSSSERKEALLVQVVELGKSARFPETLLSQSGVFIVGRQAGVHLLLDEASVSRRHAEISYSGDYYVLRDLGSMNGTFVNSVRLDSARPYVLQANDVVRFGNVVTFRFLVRTVISKQPALAVPGSSPELTKQYDIGSDGEQRAVDGQSVLNPDGSLLPPGAVKAVPAAVVATFRETPTLIVLPEKGAADSAPQVYQLRSGKRTTIGREVGNDVELSDVVVSRRHAEIFPGPDGFYIRDLGSSNGVFVNSVRLTNPYLLTHGDRIRMGSTMLFFIDLQAGREATSMMAAVPQRTEPRRTVQQEAGSARVGTAGQPAVRKPEVVICPRCGVANMPVARFCAGCSGPLLG